MDSDRIRKWAQITLELNALHRASLEAVFYAAAAGIGAFLFTAILIFRYA